MKIVYGNSICELHNPIENINSIEIKYRGSIIIKHPHREVVQKIDNRRSRIRNKNSNSTLRHENNIITILNYSELNLFKWVGEFRIISAKVNDKNVSIEVFGVDYWNLINSDWDSAGKPENYKGNYKFGSVPQKKTLKGRKNKTLRQSKGSY
tara:strand:- start:927 stop:1382 length:456 start_codon:yes stop_codon:yes gene_type:complete